MGRETVHTTQTGLLCAAYIHARLCMYKRVALPRITYVLEYMHVEAAILPCALGQ